MKWKTVVIPIDGVVGVQLDGAADELYRRLVIALQVANHTQQVQRAGVVRLGLKYPAINLLCIYKPSFLLKANGIIEQRIVCHGLCRWYRRLDADLDLDQRGHRRGV